MTVIQQTRAAPPSRPAPRVDRLLHSSWPEWLVLAIATVVRLWRLGYHSIWFDEAVSLSWARADPGYIWRVTFQLVEEKHPPVYYLGLHYWIRLGELFGLGQSDAYLRAFGSILGVITVAAVIATARRLSGRPTGLLAGILVALSPALVWYSQEVRMFQPAATLIVVGGYALLRAADETRSPQRLLWWTGMVLALTAALYSYLFSAFVLPAAGFTLLALALFGGERTQRMRRFWEGTIALALVGLLFLPLALNAWGVNDAESTPGRAFANFLPNLRAELKIFTIWRMSWPDLWLWLLAAFVIMGILLPWVQRRKPRPVLDDRLWLILWIGVPLLVANLLLGRSDSIFDEDRYLLFLAPLVLWAIARGITAIGERFRPAGWSAAVVVVLLLLLSLPRLWTPDAFRENWRAAADYILAFQEQSPGLPAAVVAHIDYTRRPLEWYARQEAGFDELPIFYPYGGALTSDDVETVVAPPLKGIAEYGAHTLWLTQSHLAGVDDQNVVERWLDENYPLVTEQFPTGIKLTGYALRSEYENLPTLNDRAIEPNVLLAPGLSLAACEITTPVVSAGDETLHPPSGWAHIRLWWRAESQMADDYIATVRVMGPEGVWGDRLYRTNEALRRTPTTTWSPGFIVRDEIDVNLNPATPSDTYPVVVGVMGSDGQPIGQYVDCGKVEIR